jgi:predicted ATPase
MQVVVVTHAEPLVEVLAEGSTLIELENDGSETSVRGQLRFDGPDWRWPKR